MDDKMIDRYITERIKKRDITLYDMIGGDYIDPDPEDRLNPPSQRYRRNRFSSLSGDLRLCELLTEEDFDADEPYKDLALPLPDLVRYWWDNLADQESFVCDVLDDVFTVYKDRMLPEKPEELKVDLSSAFDTVLEAIEEGGRKTY